MSTSLTVADLTENTEIAKKSDEFNYLMNQPVPQKWVKEHPYISGYKYLPIDKIEYLLKKIFKQYRIEIMREGQSFNGVYVTVRLHYLHPVTDNWEFHDGIGAVALQTKSGKSPADMVNINNGALGMAFPIAKSRALKNACYGFGKFFGSDLNREDTLEYGLDKNLQDNQPIEGKDWEMLKESVKTGRMSSGKAVQRFDLTADQKNELSEIEEAVCQN